MVRTNEIVRSVIICWISLTTVNLLPYSAKFSQVFNFTDFVNFQLFAKLFQRKISKASMDNMLPNPHWDALQRDTFEVGIALLTAVSSSADNGVTVHISCLYATPIYFTCAVCAWFRQRIREIISTKSSKNHHSRKFRPSKI